MTTRSKLREELTRRFVPLLRERGFNGPERIAGNALFHDFRRVTNSGTHMLSIMFDKYQRPRCVFDVWVEPPEGRDALTHRGGTLLQGRVQPRRGTSTASWFRADRPWWQRLFGVTSTREREAVSEAIATLDEIDRWWHAQQSSPHISTYPIEYRSRQLRRQYHLLSSGLSWTGVLIWAALVVAFMYQTRSALGLPMNAGPLEGLRIKLFAWIGLVLIAIPLIFYCCVVLVRGTFGLMMVLTGQFTLQEAKGYAFYSKYPEHWFQHHGA